ncbi:MAG TPA: hypothetical protein VLR88_01965, partial [Propionibacteriaceae bacterium]|nr:hypothetical protein [Propionibacteriaceae bacterium]
EASRRFHPGSLEHLLDQRIFTTADVPYRLAGLDATLADPLDTVAFDVDANTVARRREREIGGDGLLRRTSDGELYRSTLADKLLLLLAAKMVNFVPDAGIWMNTQRPEWNDANNALVGRGASVVTTAQLLGYVSVVGDLLGSSDVRLSAELADLIVNLVAVLRETPATSGISDAARRGLVQRLGTVGETYRGRVYSGDTGEPVAVPNATAHEFLSVAASWLEATLRANRRDDGLFHSYNTLAWDDNDVRVRRLSVMLEGQVAVLGSGALDADEALALVRAIRDSALYRPDQHSYLLYPNRDLPGFLDRNTLATRPEWASLASLLASRVLVEDASGALHFSADLSNAGVLAQRLNELARDPRDGAQIEADRAVILDVYEETFHHAGFTGRSGSFFAYEGLGSVYWHMVAKLALSVREATERARTEGVDADIVRGLADAYVDIRAGLGFAKDAASYGAFPADPYSHTPAHAGARQPGMTGQVKEDILNRLGELGLRVDEGIISLSPEGIIASAWTTQAGVFAYQDITGRERTVDVGAASFAFTFAQVPFVIGREGQGVTVTGVDGSEQSSSGLALSSEDSRSIIERDGRIEAVRIGCGS